MGPPYTVEVMERTARHCDELLRAAAEDAPLSFVVFVPDWRRPLQPAQVLMEASPYLRRNMLVSGRAHSYVIGDQHTSSRDRHFVLPFDTRIYCLQNAAGAARWPSDDAFEAALMGAFAET